MTEFNEEVVVPKATITRLPVYLRYLRDKLDEGEENISSTTLAVDMRLNPVQVRKDLAVVSRVSGKPKLGFNIKQLIRSIESFMGCDNVSDVLIAGVGGLGSTLLGYDEFSHYGLNIVAAFDSNPQLEGRQIHGIKIYAANRLKEIAKASNIKIGIITVPKQAAQEVASDMVQGGIKAIWNFAPTHLILPKGVAVKYEDLASSLAVLNKKLQDAAE